MHTLTNNDGDDRNDNQGQDDHELQRILQMRKCRSQSARRRVRLFLGCSARFALPSPASLGCKPEQCGGDTQRNIMISARASAQACAVTFVFFHHILRFSRLADVSNRAAPSRSASGAEINSGAQRFSGGAISNRGKNNSSRGTARQQQEQAKRWWWQG